MLRAAHLVPSLILSAFTLGACVESTELGGDELEGKVIGGDDGCPEWGCTGNSPTMGPFDFHELDLGGSDNKQGVSIARTELQNGTAVRVAFRDGTRLVAEDNQGNRYQGSQLDGLVFKLRTPSNIYLMTINHVTPQAQSNTKMWIGSPDRVETYEIIYADALTPTRTQPVCHNPPGHEMAPAGGNAWPNAFEAILFTGDRYDAYGKTVMASTYADAGEWFNLACAGSAMAKLHLSRYTTAGADATHVTVAAQRQAMLKMYTGDFCGTGWSFTQPGTPLSWADTANWNPLTGNDVGFESFWSEDGATCLTSHRLGLEWTKKVVAACGLAPCAGNPFPSSWDPHAYLKTAVPQ